MPLDNKRLSNLTMEELNKIPLDDMARSGCNIPLETKIEIYDRKCSGCGFMRVEVISGERRRTRVFDNVATACLLAQRVGADINRTCDYPGDIQIENGVEYRPTLSEIVVNTCTFWRKEGIEANDETLIIGDYNEVRPISDGQIPKHRDSGEISDIEIVSPEDTPTAVLNEDAAAGVL